MGVSVRRSRVERGFCLCGVGVCVVVVYELRDVRFLSERDGLEEFLCRDGKVKVKVKVKVK